jgi:CheY-like chemotaxis protein
MVLVVDDDPDQREPVRRVLEQAGAETVAVASADEALHALAARAAGRDRERHPQPGRDGYEFLRAVRALPRKQGGQVPAIALTADVSAEDLSRALSAGFQVHLAKPVDPARLIAAVAELAAGHRAE